MSKIKIFSQNNTYKKEDRDTQERKVNEWLKSNERKIKVIGISTNGYQAVDYLIILYNELKKR